MGLFGDIIDGLGDLILDTLLGLGDVRLGEWPDESSDEADKGGGGNNVNEGKDNNNDDRNQRSDLKSGSFLLSGSGKQKNFYSQLSLSKETIRVLILHPPIPVPGMETIHCDMETRSLSGHYEALSYEWNPRKIPGPQGPMEGNQGGEATDTQKEIFIKGQAFGVTPNLYAALWHIRKASPEGYDRVLWIDALCINQDDDDEKDMEIPRMREIYSNASRVLAWLGESTEISNQAMNFFNGLELFEFRDEVQLRDILLAADSADNSPWQKFGDGLLNRSFWSRLWVVQEVVLARQILLMCGEGVMEWEWFTSLLKFAQNAGLRIHQIPSLPPPIPSSEPGHVTRRPLFTPPGVRTGIGPVINLRERVQQGTYPDLGELLVSFRFYDATVNHDHIYALLGVAADARGPKLIPSYQRCVEDVYIDATKYMIAKYRRLDFIFVQSTSFKSLETLPSWVPDFSCTLHEDREYVQDANYPSSTIYNACASRPITETGSASLFSGSLLIGKGIFVDIISCRGDIPCPKNVFGVPMFVVIRSYESVTSQAMQLAFSGRSSSDPYPFVKGHTYWTACSHTLVYGMNWHNERCEETEGFLDSAPEEAIPSNFRPTLPDDTWKTAWKDEEWNWKTRFWDSRRFITTEKGYLGLVTAAAEVGDAVCILAGASEPVILRKREDGSWRFVGSR